MKVLTGEQMRNVDKATFDELGVSSLAVMESAGRAVAMHIVQHFENWLSAEVFLFVGSGNNGGDGFVVARALSNIGVDALVVALRPVSELQGDARKSAIAWNNSGGETIELVEQSVDDFFQDPRTHAAGLFIDCILGTGTTGPARGLAERVISEINTLSRNAAIPVIAVDIPSGVEASSGKAEGACIHADVTLSLQAPKVGNILFPGSRYGGELHVLDIGVSNAFIEDVETVGELLDEFYVQRILADTHYPMPNLHKGTRGHVAIIGGGKGKVGAAKLAGLGALKSGAGLVTLLLPESVAEGSASQLLEIMCEPLPEQSGRLGACDSEKLRELLSTKDSVVVGPGMGTAPGAFSTLESLFLISVELNIPLVIDADALNILAGNRVMLDRIPSSAVLTPHSGEMARLLEVSVSQVEADRISAVRELSKLTGCWTVLKGARTIVSSSQGELFFNPAATEALATAGSGDVLSGIIGAFLARGRSLCSATLSAVFLHGLAGSTLEEKEKGPYGIIASDIIEAVPQLLNDLLQLPPNRPKFSRRLW